METWLPIILQLVAGAVGINLAGSGAKKSLGTTLTTVLGALGGLGGGQLLGMLGVGAGSATGIASIATDVLGGGASGAIVGVVAGLLGGGKRG